MAVREEMWAQAARDRDALEAELGLRHEEERSRFLEEANERASEIIEEVGEVRVVSRARSPQGRAACSYQRYPEFYISTSSNT